MGMWPHSGKPARLWAAVFQNQNGIARYRKIVAIDLLAHLVDSSRNVSSAAVPHQMRRGRGLLQHRAIGSEVPVENRRAALGNRGSAKRANHIAVDSIRRSRHILAQRSAIYCAALP